MPSQALCPLSRLPMAAVLLLTLPSFVAAVCLAHGHGLLGSSGLAALLLTAIAAGALGAYSILSAPRSEDDNAAPAGARAPSSPRG